MLHGFRTENAPEEGRSLPTTRQQILRGGHHHSCHERIIDAQSTASPMDCLKWRLSGRSTLVLTVVCCCSRLGERESLSRVPIAYMSDLARAYAVCFRALTGIMRHRRTTGSCCVTSSRQKKASTHVKSHQSMEAGGQPVAGDGFV